MRKGILDYVVYFVIILVGVLLVYYFFLRDNKENFLLKEEKINLFIGESKDINDYIINNTKNEVNYFSTDETIVVIKNSRITAVGKGNASIVFTYTIKGNVFSKQLFVSVSSNDVFENNDLLTNVEIKNDNISLKIGDKYQVEYEITPKNISEDLLTWKSSDNTIAQVEKGVITGIGVGYATITLETSNGLKESLLVKVLGTDIERIEIVSSKSLSIKIGESSQISYNLYPNNAQNDLVFESSNTNIVSVSNTGIITGIKDGDVVVTVRNSQGNIKEEINVHVKQDSSGWSGVNRACSNSDPLDTEFNSCFVKSHHLILDTNSITISSGSKGVVHVTLPPECGTNIKYTRKSPDGEEGWRNYLTQEITNEMSTGFTWVITPNEKARGKSFVTSLTIQYDSRSPSGKCVGNVKSMITLDVKIN